VHKGVWSASHSWFQAPCSHQHSRNVHRLVKSRNCFLGSYSPEGVPVSRVSSDDLILCNALHDHFRRRRWPDAYRLIGVLGVLAFIFSVVSPYDDAIQQDFVRGRQFSVLNCKAIHCVSSTHSNPNQHAVVLQRAAYFCCFLAGRALIYCVDTSSTALLGRTAGRSPPTSLAY